MTSHVEGGRGKGRFGLSRILKGVNFNTTVASPFLVPPLRATSLLRSGIAKPNKREKKEVDYCVKGTCVCVCVCDYAIAAAFSRRRNWFLPYASAPILDRGGRGFAVVALVLLLDHHQQQQQLVDTFSPVFGGGPRRSTFHEGGGGPLRSPEPFLQGN